MLFSIIYEKNFWSIERAYQQFDQSSRQLTVLKMINLEERYLSEKINLTKEEIDYQRVRGILLQKKAESMKYLLDAIES